MNWESATNDEIDEAIDQFSGLSSAALARVCELISVVDVRQSWIADGSRTLIDWVSVRLRIRHATASRLVRVARRLVDLPVLAGVFADGELSFDQVDAISGVVTAETEQALLEQVAGMTGPALDRLARRQRGITEEETKTVWERRRLVRQWNLDESEIRFHGRLPGDAGRIFDQAIDSRVAEMPANPDTGMFDPLQTRSADALTHMAATDGIDFGTPTQVTMFVDVETLSTPNEGSAFLDNTAPLSNKAAQRLACDATIEPVLRGGEQIIGIGRRSRTIPGWLRRLVHERDGGRCQHPGCRHIRWLQVHHIIPWSRGGPTDLDNLILICGHHHRFIHEEGWHITGPSHARVFRRPDWTPFPNPRRPLKSRVHQLARST